MNTEEEILNQYKKYDYLNNKENTLIKILVSYIKPSFLFKTSILTPIHLGRAVEKQTSKDGVISDENLNWLHENCIGDDDFIDNISYSNRRVGFLTGTYWAWKNYEKLGNPDYFGSFGYRRLLESDFLENIEKYDMILPQKRNLNIETIKEQLVRYHGIDLFNMIIDVFSRTYPQEVVELENYFNQVSGYFDEIYVLKKDLFFEFCEWIFPLLMDFLNSPSVQLNNPDLRDIGFIMERITGYYLYKLTCMNYKYKELGILSSEKMQVNKAILNKELLTKLRNRI